MTTAATDLEEPEPGRYGCPVCEARLETVGDKKRHIRDKHPKQGAHR